MHKRALAIAAGLIAAVSLSVPGSASSHKDYLAMSWDEITQEAQAEGQLVFYAWWGESFWKEAAAAFKDRYGIDVTVVIGDNAIDKILSELDQETGTIDVQLIGGPNVKTAMDAGVWYGPIRDKMNGAAQLDQKLGSYQEGVETQGYLVPIYRNQTIFVYDPDRVADPPQTWEEFTAWIDANPMGFAYSDPNKGGSGQALVQTVIANLTGGLEEYKGDSEVDPAKVADWDLAWEWLRANNPKINVTLSNNESLDLLNQGAATLVVGWDDDTQAGLAKGTLMSRAQAYIPSMGLPGGGDTAGIIRNAPHKAAGLLFLDFLTSTEMQILLNQTIGSTPARGDLADLPSIIPEDQRRDNSTSWVPAAYKQFMMDGFTQNVLLGQ